MRHALVAQSQMLLIHAVGAPPRDRTSRTDRALQECKDAWSNAYKLAKEKGLADGRVFTYR
ncbi:MAG: hypothetical protein ABR991_09370 [Terracidiphilus sp.]|jgi:hypothetical protein